MALELQGLKTKTPLMLASSTCWLIQKRPELESKRFISYRLTPLTNAPPSPTLTTKVTGIGAARVHQNK